MFVFVVRYYLWICFCLERVGKYNNFGFVVIYNIIKKDWISDKYIGV